MSLLIVSHRFSLTESPHIGCAPDGRFIFRSKIFGGITHEVTTMINKSDLLNMLEREKIPLSLTFFFFLKI